MEPPADVFDAVERQIESCRRLGSPLYADLLLRVRDDLQRGGISCDLLTGASQRPHHDALPLRYLAGVHQLALAGRAPDLAQHYPSCNDAATNATSDPDAVAAAFFGTVASHRQEVLAALGRQVQTNEVGRAVVLACGLAAVSRGRAMRTFELGASAGLLSRLPWFRFETGTSVCGPKDAALSFGAEWFDGQPPLLPSRLDVTMQAACDLTPLDVSTPGGRLRAQSFVWPDQHDRLVRLRCALAVAEEHPLTVDAGDAGEWLTAQLAAPAPTNLVTVVFHSIVWQYLPPTTRDALRAALQRAGAMATRSSPLVWLRMEPATADLADLRATSWPGGEEVHLANVGYHGQQVRWRSTGGTIG